MRNMSKQTNTLIYTCSLILFVVAHVSLYFIFHLQENEGIPPHFLIYFSFFRKLKTPLVEPSCHFLGTQNMNSICGVNARVEGYGIKSIVLAISEPFEPFIIALKENQNSFQVFENV